MFKFIESLLVKCIYTANKLFELICDAIVFLVIAKITKRMVPRAPTNLRAVSKLNVFFLNSDNTSSARITS